VTPRKEKPWLLFSDSSQDWLFFFFFYLQQIAINPAGSPRAQGCPAPAPARRMLEQEEMLLQLGSLLFVASDLATGERAPREFGGFINWKLGFGHPGCFQEVSQDAQSKCCMASTQERCMGPDRIHPRVLRELAEELAKPLSIIYQRSWLTGEVPGDWRITSVTPSTRRAGRRIPGTTGCQPDLSA